MIRVRPEPATRPILHLFAYGTLQPGLVPPAIASAAARLRPLGEGYMFGKLYDLGAYPAAVIDPASAWIFYGTVFELPEDPGVLRALDAYEGDDFVRIAQLVTLTAGRVLDCWVYDYKGTPSEDRFIASRRWTGPRRP
ncbi:MAG TPA: gamma-glutamylcyclotransferase family protein [Terracidiphilus sp.]